MTSNLMAVLMTALISMTQPYAHKEMSVAQSQCLAEAVYYESRGEQLEGQIAVAYIVLNRAKQSHKSICAVIAEKGQFTFYDRKDRKVTEVNAWKLAAEVAVYTQAGFFSNPIKNATMYNTSKPPSWKNVHLVKKIGHHSFFARTAQPPPKGQYVI